MSKCSNCHKNEAVIYTTRFENGKRFNEGLCLTCASRLNIGGVSDMLKEAGINEDNVEQVTERINEMMASVGDQNPADIFQMIISADPEELKNMMSNMSDMLDFQQDETDQDADDPDQTGGPVDAVEALKMMLDDIQAGGDADQEGDSLESDTASAASEETPEEGLSLLPAGGYDRSPGEVAGEGRTGRQDGRNRRQRRDRNRKFLNQYGTNLTQAAKEGKIEPIIGREREMHRVVQILNRRTKNNPVLLGEPGVGKTALAEGLALKIADGEVPAKLLNMEVYLLDMTGMVAGTQFRGQFESRMKGIVDECKKLGNIILVIDELHNIMGAGDAEGAMNAANILKPALAKGEIRVLGSTTLDEYRRHIEKDSALERRFQKVVLAEPNEAEVFAILKGARPYYEKHHHVVYTDEVLRACARLSVRYIHDRFLPDKAIDIMDEAGSRANLNDHLLVEEQKLKEQLARQELEQNRISDQIAKSQEPTPEHLFREQATLRQQTMKLQAELEKVQEELQPHEISLEEVASVVELWTGIPVRSITESEAEKLINLEDRLHRRVVGQDRAVTALAAAIRRSRAGLAAQDRPASFIFVGPTGVGKTELVKALAEVLFDNEDALIRLDMSEYMEAHTASKLIGSPPGYVGYDDGGQLTEKIRRNPYSVILLDEIEKAHADIFNMLLQILDDGRLTDSHGRVVSFKESIIIMTSNAGTSLKGHTIGFGADTHEAMENKVNDALKELFRPEFLNRVDSVIVFESLTKTELRQIIDLMLADLNRHMEEKGLKLKVTDEAKDYITDAGYSPQYGARPLRKAIRRLIEDPLADMLLRNELAGKVAVSCDLAEDGKQLTFDSL